MLLVSLRNFGKRTPLLLSLPSVQREANSCSSSEADELGKVLVGERERWMWERKHRLEKEKEGREKEKGSQKWEKNVT